MFLLIAAAIVLFSLWKIRVRLRGLMAGDLVKVPIPRTTTGRLAQGTRLDCAAALKKHGVDVAELRNLIDGAHDQELLDRYWAMRDAVAKPS